MPRELVIPAPSIHSRPPQGIHSSHASAGRKAVSHSQAFLGQSSPLLRAHWQRGSEAIGCFLCSDFLWLQFGEILT